MKTALIAAAAVVATSFVSQASDVTKYDSTMGMSLEGAYGWAGRSDKADVAGGLLSFHQYIYSGSAYSQVSLATGAFGGSETWHYGTYNDSLSYKNRVRYIPILLGYTLNVPLTDGILFYVGGKAGINIVSDKTTTSSSYYYDRVSASGAKFAYTVGAGFKFSIGEHTDFKIGYEQYRTQYNGHSNPYHMIQAGISWNF